MSGASQFEGEAASYMMLALWCSGYDTREIGYSLSIHESEVARQIPELLRRRRALQLQSVGEWNASKHMA